MFPPPMAPIDRPHCPKRKCGLLSGAPHQPLLLEGSPHPCRQASWPQGVESNCMSIGSACSVQEHLIIIARAPARRQRDHKSTDHWEPPMGWSFREAQYSPITLYTSLNFLDNKMRMQITYECVGRIVCQLQLSLVDDPQSG